MIHMIQVCPQLLLHVLTVFCLSVNKLSTILKPCIFYLFHFISFYAFSCIKHIISVSIISAMSSVIWVIMGSLWLAGLLVSSSVYPHLTSTVGTSTVGSIGGSDLETFEIAKLPQSVSLAHGSLANLVAKKRRSIISLSSMCHTGQ